MWPFGEKHNAVQIEQWINCGIVSEHRSQRFVGISLNREAFWFSSYYTFECQRCGFKIAKSLSQLSPTERNALIALGYTELRKDKKNAETTQSSSKTRTSKGPTTGTY